MVEAAVDLRCGPLIPSVLAGDDGGVSGAVEFGTVAAFSLQVVQVLEEQYPGRLLNVVEFVGDTFLGPKVLFDDVEGVLIHAGYSSSEGILIYLSTSENAQPPKSRPV